MQKFCNVEKRRFRTLSWETSPSNVRFSWVELIPINYKLCLLRSSVICRIYMMKWKYRVPCIRDRRMAVTVSAITFTCLHINPCLLRALMGQAVSSAECMRQVSGHRTEAQGGGTGHTWRATLPINTCMWILRLAWKWGHSWCVMTMEKLVRTSIFKTNGTHQHTCNHVPLHMNVHIGHLQKSTRTQTLEVYALKQNT